MAGNGKYVWAQEFMTGVGEILRRHMNNQRQDFSSDLFRGRVEPELEMLCADVAIYVGDWELVQLRRRIFQFKAPVAESNGGQGTYDSSLMRKVLVKVIGDEEEGVKIEAKITS